MPKNEVKKALSRLKPEEVRNLINQAGVSAFGGDFELFAEIFHNIRDVADPAKRAELLLKVADYCFPRLAQIKHTDADDGPIKTDYSAAIGRFLDLVDAKMNPSVVPEKYHHLIDVTPSKTGDAGAEALPPPDSA